MRILLLAAAVGALSMPSVVYAEGADDSGVSGVPEIEIDGSVLQDLARNAPPPSGNGQPIRLIPPPETQEVSGPTLTAPAAARPVLTDAATTPEDIKPAMPSSRSTRLTEVIEEPLPEIEVTKTIEPAVSEIPASKIAKTKTPVILGPTVTDDGSDESKKVAEKAPALRAPMLTATESVAAVQQQQPATRIIQPVLREIPAPVPARVATKIIAAPLEDGDRIAEAKPVKTVPVSVANITPPPLPSRKPEAAEPATLAPPVVATAKIVETPEVTVAATKPEPARMELKVVSKPILTQAGSTPRVTIIPPPVPAPQQEVAVVAAEPVTPVLHPPVPDDAITIAAENPPEGKRLFAWLQNKFTGKPVTPQAPPVPGGALVREIDDKKIVASKDGDITFFPIETTTKKNAVLDPTHEKPAVVAALESPVTLAPVSAEPLADVVPEPGVTQKSFDAPTTEVAQASIKDAPIPGRRPAKQLASPEFVENARRTVLDTYTVMRRDGAAMPAVAKDNVDAERLPATRLSVADLAGDPLASQLLEMSPEDVAATLNNIAPAAGGGRQLYRELNAVSKPRIIRQEGERIFKSRKNIEKIATAEDVPQEQASIPETPAAKTVVGDTTDVAIVFAPGELELPDTGRQLMNAGIIDSIRAREEARIQIVAFASPTGGKESTARRTALARALAVRSYLISQGVDATRMDVRALGLQPDPKAEKDKVDLHLVSPRKG